jgi:hypothetical protein
MEYPLKPIRIVPMIIAASLLFGCKNSGSHSAGSQESPAQIFDTNIVVATKEVTLRYPSIQNVFVKANIQLLEIYSLKDTSSFEPSFIRDDLREKRYYFKIGSVGESGNRNLDSFDSLLWGLEAMFKWRSIITIIDSTNRSLATMSIFGDSTKFYLSMADTIPSFKSPKQSYFDSGSDRIKIPLSDIHNRYPEIEGSKTGRTIFPCEDMIDINGRLYFKLGSYSVRDDQDDSPGFNRLIGYSLIDAVDGTKWDYQAPEESGGSVVVLQRTKNHYRLLHQGLDPSGRTWHVVESDCGDSTDPHLWQYRPIDGRLQRLDLENLEVLKEMQVDTTGMQGRFLRYFETYLPNDTVAYRFALVQRKDGYFILRSDVGQPFPAHLSFQSSWRLPDTSLWDALSISKDTGADSSSLKIRYSNKSFPVKGSDWQPLPKTKTSH